MDNIPKILAFAGSLRHDSFNKKLVKIAAAGARKAGAEVQIVNLEHYHLPLYNADDEAEEGLPPGAKELKQLVLEHDGLLIASPEYNSSVTAPLKNALDWVSRPEKGDEERLIAYRGKYAAIMSASPGNLGGLRGLVHVRSILENIGVTVLPDQVTICAAHDAFNESGQLKDPQKLERALGLGASLAELLKKLKN